MASAKDTLMDKSKFKDVLKAYSEINISITQVLDEIGHMSILLEARKLKSKESNEMETLWFSAEFAPHEAKEKNKECLPSNSEKMGQFNSKGFSY